MKYDVFISYRREGGFETAKHLNDLLVRYGYKVSFDIDTLGNGDFDVQLLERIEQCKDFILIVDQHAFDRTLDPTFDRKKDWLRCELAHALKHNKNIIPIFLSGVKGFPEGLPDDVKNVITKSGPKFDKFFFNYFYKTLKSRFLHKPLRRKVYICAFFISVIFLSFSAYILSSPKEPQITITLPTLNSSRDDWGESVDAKNISRYCSLGFYNIPVLGLNNGAIAGTNNVLLYPIIANKSSKSVRDLYVKIEIFYDAPMKSILSYLNTEKYNITSQTENRISLSYKGNILHPHMIVAKPLSMLYVSGDDGIDVVEGEVTFCYTITYDGANEPIHFEYIAKIYYSDDNFTTDFIGNANYAYLDEYVYSNRYNPLKPLYKDGEWIIIYHNNLYRDIKHLSNKEFKELKINQFSNLQN